MTAETGAGNRSTGPDCACHAHAASSALSPAAAPATPASTAIIWAALVAADSAARIGSVGSAHWRLPGTSASAEMEAAQRGEEVNVRHSFTSAARSSCRSRN